MGTARSLLRSHFASIITSSFGPHFPWLLRTSRTVAQRWQSVSQFLSPIVISNGNSESNCEWGSIVVKLSFDSKSRLMGVKTSLKPQFAELIRREVIILKTVKYPLIVELLPKISHAYDHNSAITTQFAGNGLLTNHLSSAECPLSSTNRITRIIIGIGLMM
jgi:serine/threonine protein kinase